MALQLLLTRKIISKEFQTDDMVTCQLIRFDRSPYELSLNNYVCFPMFPSQAGALHSSTEDPSGLQQGSYREATTDSTQSSEAPARAGRRPSRLPRCPKRTIPKIMVMPPTPTEKSAAEIIRELNRQPPILVKGEEQFKFATMRILKQERSEVIGLGGFTCNLYPTAYSLPLDRAAKMIYADNKGEFVTQDEDHLYRADMGFTNRRLFFAIFSGYVNNFKAIPGTQRLITQDRFLNYNLAGLNEVVLCTMGVHISLPDVGGRRVPPISSESLVTGEGGFESGDSRAVSINPSPVSSGRSSPSPTPGDERQKTQSSGDQLLIDLSS